MFDTVIKGTVVLCDDIMENGYVAVKNGKVQDVGVDNPPTAQDTRDYADCYILPGAVDAQVHSLSQKNQEGFEWSSRSAVAGGVTTMIDMPYDEGALISTAERLSEKARDASQTSIIDFGLYGTCHPDDGTEHIAPMVDAGACAFKFSTFGTDPERFPRIPPFKLHAFFTEIAKHDVTAGVHNENDEFVNATLQQVYAQGITDYRSHGLSRPPIAETLAMTEIYEIGADTGCPAHVVHCSVGRGYEICRTYKQQGYATSIEACIHYLPLNEEQHVARLGGKAKINPPVRSKAEVESLWQHLRAGNIDMVSTDHVSWSENRKTHSNMLQNSSGVPGLEVLYALLLKGLYERDLPFTWASKLLAKNPAEHFRLSHVKGAIEIGKDADIVVMAHDPYVYHAGDSGHNVVHWSPYEGMELPFKPVATYLRGTKIFDGTDILVAQGNGQFITPPQAKNVTC